MNKKLFAFRFSKEFENDLFYLQNKFKTKNKTQTIEKAIKSLIKF
jgi:hypothetical protein